MEIPSSSGPVSFDYAGFGDPDHHSPLHDQADKAYRIGLRVLLGVATLAAASIVIAVAWPAVLTIAAAVVLSAGFLAAAITAVHLHRKAIEAHIAVQSLERNQYIQPALGIPSFTGNGHVSVCANAAAMDRQLHTLVDRAEHNLVLVNPYSGGTTLMRLLERVERKLEERADFRFAFLCSPLFLNESNREELKRLQSTYPDRVVISESSRSVGWYGQPKVVDVHAKFACIDYGRDFIVGSSGLEDRYTQADSLPRAGFSDRFMPNAFLDMDLSVEGTSGNSGHTLYCEALKLISVCLQKAGSAEPNRHLQWAQRPDGIARPSTAGSTPFEVLLTAPEHEHNRFTQRLLESIRASEEEILLSHLYLHPSQEVEDALVDAIRRGVRLRICTNDAHSNGPWTHVAFGHRSMRRIHALLHRLTLAERERVGIYLFRQPMATMHKKVAVFDQKRVLMGSSNLGTKSLQTSSDYECSVVVDDPEMARQVQEACVQTEFRGSRHVPGTHFCRRTTPSIRMLAGIQSIIGPIIG